MFTFRDEIGRQRLIHFKSGQIVSQWTVMNRFDLTSSYLYFIFMFFFRKLYTFKLHIAYWLYGFNIYLRYRKQTHKHKYTLTQCELSIGSIWKYANNKKKQHTRYTLLLCAAFAITAHSFNVYKYNTLRHWIL